MKRTYKIIGIHCPACVKLISMEVEEVDGVESISLDEKTGQAEVVCSETVDESHIIHAIEQAGDYSVET